MGSRSSGNGVKANARIHIVPTRAEDCRSLEPGEKLPAFTLQTADDQPFDVQAALAEGPLILVFYRGAWCPHCEKQLLELNTYREPFAELGYRILGISPDCPAFIANWLQTHDIDFPLLSDSEMAGAKAMGVAFQLDKKMIAEYKRDGFHLERVSGKKHYQLPIPSVFFVGTDGTLGFNYVNPDYRVRIPVDLLLAVAKATK